MFFSSIKGTNRLISKEMSNTYLKVTIEKNWASETFRFLNLKNMFLGQFLGRSNSLKLWTSWWKPKTQRSGSKTVCDFSITLILKGNVAF